MNKEEIIRMAREAGWPDSLVAPIIMAKLAEFATLVAAAERERVMQIVQSMKADLEAKFENVYMEGAMAGAAAEREACARVCEQRSVDGNCYIEGSDEADGCAAAIRKRSNP